MASGADPQLLDSEHEPRHLEFVNKTTERHGRYVPRPQCPTGAPPPYATDTNIISMQPIQSPQMIVQPPEKDMVVDACVWLMASFISIWFFLFTGCVAFILSIYMVQQAATGRHVKARGLLPPIKLLTVASFLIGVLAGVITLFVFTGITISQTESNY